MMRNWWREELLRWRPPLAQDEPGEAGEGRMFSEKKRWTRRFRAEPARNAESPLEIIKIRERRMFCLSPFSGEELWKGLGSGQLCLKGKRWKLWSHSDVTFLTRYSHESQLPDRQFCEFKKLFSVPESFFFFRKKAKAIGGMKKGETSMGGFFTALNRPTGNSACVLLRPFFCVLAHWHWSLVENKNKITIRGFGAVPSSGL